MKVAAFETQVVELPKGRGTLGEIPGQVTPWYTTLRLRTDDGIEGIAYAAYVSRAVAPALKATLDGLCEQVVGRDPFETDAIGRDLRMRNGGTAPAGLVTRASSAIDVALWDIKGKALGLPCWKLLGGSEGRVRTYGSGHLWRHYNLEELQEWGPTLVQQGFRAMKLRCGAESSAAAEVERMRVLREAVGDDIDIMIDINQGWTVHQATTIGRQLSEHRLYWLEDPTQHQDYAGMARIAAALDTPVCSGEYHYGLVPFRHMVEARSIDIMMVDLFRVGGFTEYVKGGAPGRGVQPAGRDAPGDGAVRARGGGHEHAPAGARALGLPPLRGGAAGGGRDGGAGRRAGPGPALRRGGAAGDGGRRVAEWLTRDDGGRQGESLAALRRRVRLLRASGGVGGEARQGANHARGGVSGCAESAAHARVAGGLCGGGPRGDAARAGAAGRGRMDLRRGRAVGVESGAAALVAAPAEPRGSGVRGGGEAAGVYRGVRARRRTSAPGPGSPA